MAQPQAQRDLFFQLGVIGLGSLHLKKKKRKKKSTFLFFLAPNVIEIHQVSWALKRQHGCITNEAVTWILFRGTNQAPTAAFESFRNAPGPQRGVITKADATDKILRLKFQTERIKVTSKTQHLIGGKRGVELGGRVLSI